MILSLIVFVSLTMLSFENIAPLLNSLTFVPPYLPPLSQILDEAYIPSVIASDPLVAAPDSSVDFSVQPPDILDFFHSSPFNEHVEDKQVEDELPNLEPGSLALAPPDDLA